MTTSIGQSVTIRTLNDSQCHVRIEQDGLSVTATATILPFGSSRCVNFFPPLYPIGVPSALVGELADPRVLVRMVLQHVNGLRPGPTSADEDSTIP